MVTYTQFQDNDDATWNNTATATLFADGTIEVVYGQVISQDILVGIFDGTHTGDTTVTVQPSYDYSTTGTGVILFDHFGGGASNTGGLLNGQTITFVP